MSGDPQVNPGGRFFMTCHLSKKLKQIGKKLERCNPGSMIIIGLGNPDRADDGAGIQLAGLLEKRFPDQVFSERERSVEGLVLEHIEAQKTETILFVDAASFSPVPGE